MITRETKDKGEIKSVLCHPAIWDTIATGVDMLPDDFDPPISKEYEYLGGYVDDEIMALMVYHIVDGIVKVHVQVLPEYRKDYALEFGKKAIENGEKYGQLYAEIPTCYPNVLEFAALNGFEHTGTRDNEYKRNGLYYDVHELERYY